MVLQPSVRPTPESAVATLALPKDNLLALDPAGGGAAGIQYQWGEFNNAAISNVAVVGSDERQIAVTESIVGELYARSVKAIFANGRSPGIVEAHQRPGVFELLVYRDRRRPSMVVEIRLVRHAEQQNLGAR